MALSSRLTAAVLANNRPSTAAPVVTVMEAMARMFPLNTEPVPRVAELPTCQKTFAALAPPLKMTWRSTVVVRGGALSKMDTAFTPGLDVLASSLEIPSGDLTLHPHAGADARFVVQRRPTLTPTVGPPVLSS